MLKNSTQTVNTNVSGPFPTQIHKFFLLCRNGIELIHYSHDRLWSQRGISWFESLSHLTFRISLSPRKWCYFSIFRVQSLTSKTIFSILIVRNFSSRLQFYIWWWSCNFSRPTKNIKILRISFLDHLLCRNSDRPIQWWWFYSCYFSLKTRRLIIIIIACERLEPISTV